MKRIESPPKIIYLDRDLGGSLLHVYLLCVVVLIAWAIRKGPHIVLWSWALALLIAVRAFVKLFQVRAFVIDPEEEDFVVIERSLLGPNQRITIPLARVEPWLVDDSTVPIGPAQVRRVTYYAVAQVPGVRTFVLASGRHREPMELLAREFAQDIGRPLLTTPI